MIDYCGERVDIAYPGSICSRDKGHAGRHLAVRRKVPLVEQPERLKMKAQFGILGEVDLEIERLSGIIWNEGRQVGQTDPAFLRDLMADSVKGLSVEVSIPYCDHNIRTCTVCGPRRAAEPGKCWRHDYEHREYICTCDPVRADDSGMEP